MVPCPHPQNKAKWFALLLKYSTLWTCIKRNSIWTMRPPPQQYKGRRRNWTHYEYLVIPLRARSFILPYPNPAIIFIPWSSTTDLQVRVRWVLWAPSSLSKQQRKKKVTYVGNTLSIRGTHKGTVSEAFVSSRPMGPVQWMTINNIL